MIIFIHGKIATYMYYYNFQASYRHTRVHTWHTLHVMNGVERFVRVN